MYRTEDIIKRPRYKITIKLINLLQLWSVGNLWRLNYNFNSFRSAVIHVTACLLNVLSLTTNSPLC